MFADDIGRLEDGKMRKRHLVTSYRLTRNAYRERWGLPLDYWMVASNHSAKCSGGAKSLRLGRKQRMAKAAE